MSIVAVGFLAYDTVETPNGKVEEVLGGGASYFAIAARFFSPVSIVAVVGSDFKPEDFQLFTDRNIDVRGVARREGKTTRWHGRYHEDMNMRDTVALSLNVLENFTPELLPDQRRFRNTCWTSCTAPNWSWLTCMTIGSRTRGPA